MAADLRRDLMQDASKTRQHALMAHRRSAAREGKRAHRRRIEPTAGGQRDRVSLGTVQRGFGPQ
jgi:hypothetical protein